jgi:hypothetical protein
MRFYGHGWSAKLQPNPAAPDAGECMHCAEPVLAGEPHARYLVAGEAELSPALHRECFLRLLYGSTLHQQGRCRCAGGPDEDEPDLSTRNAARAAVYWHEYQGGRRKQ